MPLPPASAGIVGLQTRGHGVNAFRNPVVLLQRAVYTEINTGYFRIISWGRSSIVLFKPSSVIPVDQIDYGREFRAFVIFGPDADIQPQSVLEPPPVSAILDPGTIQKLIRLL